MDKEYFLSILGGAEGGLMTTTAIMSGLIIGTNASKTLILSTAVISFSVQAFNGAIGKFSSEHTSDEIDGVDVYVGYKKPLIDAILQFSFHILLSGLVVLPFYYLDSLNSALLVSLLITVVCLFILGSIKGRAVGSKAWRDGQEFVLMGVAVIIIGIIAGVVL